MTPRGTHFLSCDWGTSSFRLRLVARDDLRVVAVVESGEGVRTLHTGLVERGVAADGEARDRAFGGVLSRAIGRICAEHPEWAREAPVVISGMASSTVGWRELPYASTPCALDGGSLRIEAMEPLAVEGSRHRVWMVSGLSCGTDMMRGEETELLGILAWPGFAALRRRSLLVLPGTHSKHVRVVDGAVVEFRTFMTGELVEVLSTKSLLSVSVDWPPPAMEEGPFLAGLDAARGMGLGRGLFQVRVRSVLGGEGRAGNSWYLAGLVIGAEILDLLAWDPDPSTPILLAASARFAATYRMAVGHLGGGARVGFAGSELVMEATVRAHASVLGRREA